MNSFELNNRSRAIFVGGPMSSTLSLFYTRDSTTSWQHSYKLMKLRVANLRIAPEERRSVVDGACGIALDDSGPDRASINDFDGYALPWQRKIPE
jgi:hypothetical protein